MFQVTGEKKKLEALKFIVAGILPTVSAHRELWENHPSPARESPRFRMPRVIVSWKVHIGHQCLPKLSSVKWKTLHEVTFNFQNTGDVR